MPEVFNHEKSDTEQQFVVGRERPVASIGEGFQYIGRFPEISHGGQNGIMHITGISQRIISGGTVPYGGFKTQQVAAQLVNCRAERGNQLRTAGAFCTDFTDVSGSRSHIACKTQDGRKDLAPGHHNHRIGFDSNNLCIGTQADIPAGTKLGFGKYLMRFKQADVLFGRIAWQGVHSGIQPGQTALFCFFQPLVSIVVSVKDDALMLMNSAHDQVMESRTEICCVFQFIRKLTQAFRNNSIENNVRVGNGVG